MPVDSNRTLRFPRTAREAFGHSLEFESPSKRTEAAIFLIAAFAAGFLLGFFTGGVL